MCDSLSNYSAETRLLSDSDQEIEQINVVMKTNHLINQYQKNEEVLKKKIQSQKQKINQLQNQLMKLNYEVNFNLTEQQYKNKQANYNLDFNQIQIQSDQFAEILNQNLNNLNQKNQILEQQNSKLSQQNIQLQVLNDSYQIEINSLKQSQIQKEKDLTYNLNLVQESQKQVIELKHSLNNQRLQNNETKYQNQNTIQFFKTIIVQKLFPTLNTIFKYFIQILRNKPDKLTISNLCDEFQEVSLDFKYDSYSQNYNWKKERDSQSVDPLIIKISNQLLAIRKFQQIIQNQIK